MLSSPDARTGFPLTVHSFRPSFSHAEQPGGIELEEGVIPAEVFVPEKKSAKKYPEPVILDDGL